MKKNTFDKRAHLNCIELAARWSTTPRTLEDWRTDKKGPRYIKLGNAKKSKVLYRIADIEEYEKKMTKETNGKR